MDALGYLEVSIGTLSAKHRNQQLIKKCVTDVRDSQLFDLLYRRSLQKNLQMNTGASYAKYPRRVEKFIFQNSLESMFLGNVRMLSRVIRWPRNSILA